MAKGQIKNKREVQKLITIAEYAKKNLAAKKDEHSLQITGMIQALKWVIADDEATLEKVLGSLESVYDPEMALDHSDLV